MSDEEIERMVDGDNKILARIMLRLTKAIELISENMLKPHGQPKPKSEFDVNLDELQWTKVEGKEYEICTQKDAPLFKKLIDTMQVSGKNTLFFKPYVVWQWTQEGNWKGCLARKKKVTQ